MNSGMPIPAVHSLVGRASAVELLERVSRRVEDELDRIDERAVEVEQDGWAPEARAGLERAMAIEETSG